MIFELIYYSGHRKRSQCLLHVYGKRSEIVDRPFLKICEPNHPNLQIEAHTL